MAPASTSVGKHDKTALREIHWRDRERAVSYEELGIAPPGEAAAVLRSGETSLEGRVPVNPSGGLLSRGHPVGATGCAQLVELTDQLRGRCGARQVDGARIALAENGGGWLGGDVAAVTITILGR